MRAIVAYLTAKPGMEAKFKEEMTAQAKRCLANEPGCLQFDVAQDPKEPTLRDAGGLQGRRGHQSTH